MVSADFLKYKSNGFFWKNGNVNNTINDFFIFVF